MSKVLIKVKSLKELLEDGYIIEGNYISKENSGFWSKDLGHYLYFSFNKDYCDKVFLATIREGQDFIYNILPIETFHESQVRVLKGKLIETLYDYSKE